MKGRNMTAAEINFELSIKLINAPFAMNELLAYSLTGMKLK